MAFEHLDLVGKLCFGHAEDGQSWREAAVASMSRGWDEEIRGKIEAGLAADVDASYFNICVLDMKDVSSGIVWRAKFVNDKSCWELSIRGSERAKALENDKSGFFQSEDFKTACREAADCISRSDDVYRQVVDRHVKEGEMLEVDTVKLEAVLWWIEREGGFMDNFRQGKYAG